MELLLLVLQLSFWQVVMHSIYTASCLKTIFNNFYEKGRKSEYSQSKDMPKVKYNLNKISNLNLAKHSCWFYVKSKEARLLWMFCVFCPAIAAQLQQCLPNKCSEETNQQNTFARGKLTMQISRNFTLEGILYHRSWKLRSILAATPAWSDVRTA